MENTDLHLEELSKILRIIDKDGHRPYAYSSAKASWPQVYVEIGKLQATVDILKRLESDRLTQSFEVNDADRRKYIVDSKVAGFTV